MIWRNLNLLRETRAATIVMVRDLAQDDAGVEALPGKWTLGEQLDHLLLAERLYRREISELIALAKSGEPPVIRRTTRDINFRPNLIPEAALPMLEVPFAIANLFIPRAMREAMVLYQVLPSQRPDIARPARGRPVAELRSSLEASLAETAALLEDHRGMDFDRMRVEHPLLGSNNVPSLVKLTALHEQRHQRQIEALLSALLRRRV
jgi:hypothetical protein